MTALARLAPLLAAALAGGALVFGLERCGEPASAEWEAERRALGRANDSLSAGYAEAVADLLNARAELTERDAGAGAAAATVRTVTRTVRVLVPGDTVTIEDAAQVDSLRTAALVLADSTDSLRASVRRLLVADSVALAGADRLIATLRQQVAHEQRRPTPRLARYGALAYDVRSGALVPVLGAEWRLLGPISLTGEVGYDADYEPAKERVRARIGVRIRL